jgi:dsRNA-specific ribonuclease
MKRNIKSAIKRFRKQLEDKRLDRDSKNGKTAFLQKTVKRQLYLKQLADVVESITGAVALACGLNFVQVFLHNIGILSETQDSLKQHMERLT